MREERKPIEKMQFENVSFRYHSRMPLFTDLNFDFPMNTTVRVVSEGAEGKSTLLQLMAGLVVPNSGRFLLNGLSVGDMSFEELLPYRLNIGYGFDSGGLIHNRTIEENILLPLFYHRTMSGRLARKRVHEYMERLEIIDAKDDRPSFVRGRVKKMACLIRALAHHPDVLLLDDPSVGLSQELSVKLLELIAEIQKEGRLQTVYITSYDQKFLNLVKHESIYLSATSISTSPPERVEPKAVGL